MADLAQVVAPVSPLLVAAVLLLGRDYVREHALPCATVEQVLMATGASRSRAYELREALRDVLPSLLRPVGRPPAPPREARLDTTYALRGAVATFLMDHPGCVYGGAERRRYDDGFRRFILDLREQHHDVQLEPFAEAILLPLGTLKEWLAAGASSGTRDPDKPDNDDTADATTAATTLRGVQIQTVIASWKTWHGGFLAFCDHVQRERRLPFGRSLIDQILRAHGARKTARRRGRSPDERALRGAFETFFGGAQWVGDGSPITVSIEEQRFGFNLEIMVDAYSGGFVGMSVRDAEDSAAVVEALGDGLVTTGEAPLAVLLDNRPSNHTSEVDAALGDVTARLRATPFRPQNKAHCEGGFGLFQQAIPALALHGHDPREHARQLLTLVFQTFARVINHRPRRDRDGRSRIELYNEPITAEQIDAARAALEERCRKQELARATLKARQDPVTRALLDDAFTRLGLLDPEHHLRLAIARYSIDAVLEGLAIFNVKRRMGTLPAGVDARYLLGIVRNIDDQREGVAIAEELLRLRLDARDRLLAPLVTARDAARDGTPDVPTRVLRFVDLALAADRGIDRSFWLCAAAAELGAAEIPRLALVVARRIHATHRVPRRERDEAVRVVLGKVTPLG